MTSYKREIPLPIRLVCFDLGRVLVRLCDNWRHACELAGLPAPPAKFDPAVRAKLEQLISLSDTGRLDLHDFARAAAPLLRVDPDHVTALSNAYVIEPFPGVEKLLTDIAARGVKTACLSNTNASHWQMLGDPDHPAALPLDRFTHRFASHLLGLRKPDPAIYAHVERSTGAAGHHIAFFDDVAENIHAARARQWRAFLIERTDDPVSQVRRHLVELQVL
jgi:glucose-1-phosphatase